MIFSLIFVYVFFIIFRFHLSFGILFIADENEVKTNPDVDYISNSCDDQVVQCNENGYEQNLNQKRVRKQMTILDYCKSTKIKNINEIEPLSIEYNVKIHSSPSPSPSISSTVTIMSQELGSEGNSLSPASSISSLATVKSRKRNHEDTSPLPVSVESVKRQRRGRSTDTLTNKSFETIGSTSKSEACSSTEKNLTANRKRSVSSTTVTKKSHEQNSSINETQAEEKSPSSKKSRGNKSIKKSGEKSSSTNDSVEEEIYIVEKVVGIDVIENAPHFHIKWKGYSVSHNTWEPLSNLNNCLNLLTKFLETEVEVRKNTIENILLDLNAANATIAFTDEEAFLKLNNFDSIYVLSHLVLLAIIRESSDGHDESYNVLYEKLRQKEENFMLFSFWLRRNEQLKDLEEWQNLINKFDKSSQITVENNFDFEKSPSTFQYINDCVAGEGVVIPDDPLIGCDCKDGCSTKSNCCGKQLGSKYAYTSSRGIRLPQGNAVFECNKLCKCGADCTNRVVQQGRKHSLTIFKTSNGRGWGVRTDRVIAKGQFICEYVGEIITNKEAEARGLIYDAEKRTYLFDLDCNSIVENKENLYTIDACKIGNVSRMINHSCDPNIGTWSVWINCLDLDIPKICFYALRRIEAGEELSFDYLSFSVHDVGTEMDTNNDQSMANVKTNFECKCNSAKCRKYIFDPDLLNPADS